MAGLMDMRELGMLRNATQRMERGGGIDMDEWRRRRKIPVIEATIDMDEWRRRKAAEEQSVAEQAIAAARAHPAYQALKRGASGGPFAAGAIVRSLPFLRAGPAAVDIAKAAGRGASTAGKYLKSKLWSPGYPGASRKGEMVFGRDASGKSVRRIASRPGEWKYSGRPTKRGAAVGEAATLGAAGAAYLASRDDEPELEETVEVVATKPKEPTKKKKELANLPNETEPNKPNLWKTWGSLADNPKERKKAYLSSIKNIYMKKMLLDSIAKLTGGKSQGDTWAQMAIAELDAIEKFDSEERTHNQWKALFFNEDGTYNPPKNREQAIKRGLKLNYGADELKDVLTVFPKDSVAMRNYNWYKEAEGEDKRLIGELLGIDAKGGTVDLFSPANIATLINSDAFLNDFSDDEQARVMEIVRTMIPGFIVPAPQGAIDKLMSNPTPKMRKAFREKYGYLPEGL